jgi:hypothetical protein
MTVIMRDGFVFPSDASRRKRTLACALERRAAGTVPVVSNLMIVIGVVLLLVAAFDLVLMLGVLF